MTVVVLILGSLLAGFGLKGLNDIKDGRARVSEENVPHMIGAIRFTIWLGVSLVATSGLGGIASLANADNNLIQCQLKGNCSKVGSNSENKKEKETVTTAELANPIVIPSPLEKKDSKKANLNKGIDKCSLTIMSSENCITFVNDLLAEYGQIDFASEKSKFENVEFTTECPEGTWDEHKEVRMGVEAQFLHPDLNIYMEVEKNKHAQKIEDEFEGLRLSIDQLPTKVFNSIKSDHPNVTTFEKEVRRDGTIAYEIEPNPDIDYDVTYNENGEEIYNTCEGGTPECPECP